MKAGLPFLMTAALLALGSCGDPDRTDAKGAAGYVFVDVEELIGRQARWLDSVRPEVQKIIMAEGKEEKLQTRSLSWEKELAIFKELNLDKPGLRASYLVASPAPQVRLFTRKPGEHTELQWLKLSFDAAGHLLAMDGVTGRSNYLYHSEKRLQMWFGTGGTLTGYLIDSRKNIIFSAQERLVVRGRLLAP